MFWKEVFYQWFKLFYIPPDDPPDPNLLLTPVVYNSALPFFQLHSVQWYTLYEFLQENNILISKDFLLCFGDGSAQLESLELVFPKLIISLRVVLSSIPLSWHSLSSPPTDVSPSIRTVACCSAGLMMSKGFTDLLTPVKFHDKVIRKC